MGGCRSFVYELRVLMGKVTEMSDPGQPSRGSSSRDSALYTGPRFVYMVASKPRVLFFCFVDLLQDELTKEEDCVSDVVFLCLAGLKQVGNVVFLILSCCPYLITLAVFLNRDIHFIPLFIYVFQPF